MSQRGSAKPDMIGTSDRKTFDQDGGSGTPSEPADDRFSQSLRDRNDSLASLLNVLDSHNLQDSEEGVPGHIDFEPPTIEQDAKDVSSVDAMRKSIRRMRRSIKDHILSTCSGYLNEMEIGARFDAAGVRNWIKAPELSPVDGVFFHSAACDDPAVPCPQSDDSARWRWAQQQKTVKFIPFDFKYVSLRSIRHDRKEDYGFTIVTNNSIKPGTELYVIGFEGVDDFIAIVPQPVWDASGDAIVHGVDPLVSKVPRWNFPFVVQDSKIASAVDRLVEVAMTGQDAYENPTTGCVLSGYTPRTTTEPMLVPDLNSQGKGPFEAETWLYDQLRSAGKGLVVHFNPIAPMLCDFMLEIPGLSEPLRVEVKLARPLEDDGNLTYAAYEGYPSPFAELRQWHFIITQARHGVSKFVCVGRHQIPDSWKANLTSPVVLPYREYGRFVWKGESALTGMIDYMASEGEAAILRAAQVLETVEIEDMDYRQLISSKRNDVIDNIQALIDEEDELESGAEESQPAAPHPRKSKQTDAQGLHFHQAGLPWVSSVLNQQCREARRGICFPLDRGHSVCNHVIADLLWTQQQVEAYDESRQMPVLPFSAEACQLRCIPLKLVDMHGGVGKNSTMVMRARYWTVPTIDQGYILIGSMLPPAQLQHPITSHRYLMFPSGFTTQSDHAHRAPDSAQPGYRGENYFRKVTEDDDVLDKKTWSSSKSEQKPFEKGSMFIKDADVNPLRYMVELESGDVYRQLMQIFDSSSDVCIGVGNTMFDPKPYVARVRDIHQANWDFGLKRKPHLAGPKAPRRGG